MRSNQPQPPIIHTMKTKTTIALLAALAATPALPAAVPSAVSYQGAIKIHGTNFTGGGQFKFAVIARPTGASLWSNDGTSVNGSAPATTVLLGVTNGLFTVGLGDASLPGMQALPPETFASQPDTALRVWFNDGVNGWSQLAPDTRLTAVPYAMAAPLPLGSITATNLASNTIDPSKLNAVNAPQPGRVLSYDLSGRFNWTDLSVVNNTWARNGTAAYYNGGSVGIGTATPATSLDVRGHLTLDSGGDAALFTGTGSAEWNRYLMLLNSIGTSTASGLKAGGILVSDAYDYARPGKNDLIVKGKVGIGTAVPTSPLQVHQASWNTTGIPNISITGENAAMEWSSASLPGHEYRWLALGGNSRGLEFWHRSLDYSSFPAQDSGWVKKATLHTDGTLELAGSASVRTLTIRGGADLAEPFPMSAENIDKGSVVVIDPEKPGHLKLSHQAYDKRVAGIVSGANGINPGIALHQEGALDLGENVALTGRVYVKADAAHGVIEPGDLLTTSDTPGHAMKVSDSTKAQGAILGKAMSGLKEGTGLVLVLVSLQ